MGYVVFLRHMNPDMPQRYASKEDTQAAYQADRAKEMSG